MQFFHITVADVETLVRVGLLLHVFKAAVAHVFEGNTLLGLGFFHFITDLLIVDLVDFGKFPKFNCQCRNIKRIILLAADFMRVHSGNQRKRGHPNVSLEV